MAEAQFVNVGERIRYIGTSKYRHENWPEDAWLEKGITGTVTEFHKESPEVRVGGERFEAIPAYAAVTWDFGGKTAIDPEYEGKTWERIELPTRGGNPNGTCYEDAWRFLIKEEEGELVHGSVQTIGKRINHAWVELPTGFVWEPESGEFMKKSYFYERAKPQEEARYSATEAAIMVARVGKHGPWTKEEREQFLKGGNPDRVRFDRASIDSAITAAKRLQSEKDLYVFATHLGFTIDSRPPPGVQQYIVVHPDGTTETIKPFESNPTGNPMGKLISEEAAIGMLERLSMTPDEARRSLFGSEEERRAIMIAVQERVKREQNKWAPFDPREGPPLPRIFAGLRWPWKQ